MPLLHRLAGLLVAIPLLIAAFLLAWVVFAVVVAGALVVGAWFWWKTRHVRRVMAEHAAQPPRRPGGAVIEGEYRVEQGAQHAEKKLP